MRKLIRQIKGTVRVEICGAFPESLLNRAALCGIELWELECVDDWTLRFTLYEKRLGELESAARYCMCDMRVLDMSGGSRGRARALKRIWLLLSAALTALVLVLSSLFIWEIDVSGCEKISEGRILRALAECGVSEGTYWPTLSADMVRSRMMLLIPEIGWMTVNVQGSRAQVIISERGEKPKIFTDDEPADIIAGRAGVIKELSILNGSCLVGTGQAVLEGETLVSGKVESITNAPRYVRAQAVVKADTWYEISAKCPPPDSIKTENGRRHSRYALKIGKNRINFYIAGRNNIDECDKIIHEYKIGVEGLFLLPVSIVREEFVHSRTESTVYDPTDGMRDALYKELTRLTNGTVKSLGFSSCDIDGATVMTLRANCIEDIGVSSFLAREDHTYDREDDRS